MVEENLAVNPSDSASDTIPTSAEVILKPESNKNDEAEDVSKEFVPDKKYVPYSRFKEVIDQRNSLREQVEEIKNMDRDMVLKEGPIGDDDLNDMWHHNPAQAAKITFSKIILELDEKNKIATKSLENTLQRYPELNEANHEFTQLTSNIICKEMPELLSEPEGISIAAEIAAARYYREKYHQLADNKKVSLQDLEATRAANLKNAHIELGSKPKGFGQHDALNSSEQRIAKLMGVPLDKYVKYKSNK